MQDPKSDSQKKSDETGAYEAPRVESVVTSDEVEREAVFGGGISMS
jgi:hypothetical protein